MNFKEFLENEMTVPKALHILGLELPLSLDALKSKYRELSIKHHPDKGGSEEKFKKITDAFNLLQTELETNNLNSGSDKKQELMKKYPSITKLFDKKWERSDVLTFVEKVFLKDQRKTLLRRGYLYPETIKHVEDYLSKVYSKKSDLIENTIPIGQCFQWAAKTALDKFLDGTLVHGLISTNDHPEPYYHAWIEHNDRAYDWQMQVENWKTLDEGLHSVPVEEYRKNIQILKEKRYKPARAIGYMHKEKNWGPWEI